MIPKIKYSFSIFGERKMENLLFNGQEKAVYEQFRKNMKKLFVISPDESQLLARHLFEIGEEIKEVDPLLVKNTDFVSFRLQELCGEYTSYTDDILDQITLEFVSLFKSSKT